MKCDSCASAFAQADRVKAVQDASGHPCGCESCNASPTSPGQVADSETLFVIVSDPTDIQDGHIAAHVGVQIDRGGWSALREGAADEEFVQTFEEMLIASKGDKFFFGVFSFKVGDIRYMCCGRFMCIYDTALPKKPHHADVMSPTHLSNSMKKKRVKALLDRVGPTFIPADQFREGRFLEYARR